jgi:hypothetical protein
MRQMRTFFDDFEDVLVVETQDENYKTRVIEDQSFKASYENFRKTIDWYTKDQFKEVTRDILNELIDGNKS